MNQFYFKILMTRSDQMDWQLLKQIGHDVYKCEDWRDNKRYYSFLARAFINRHVMEQHLNSFYLIQNVPLLWSIVHGLSIRPYEKYFIKILLA